ncbi:tetratricopeptide repeat protein [Vreelandella sp. EE7]
MNHVLASATVLLALALSGCAGVSSTAGAPVDACRQLAPEQQLAVELANDMAEQGRPHAALAHLEQLPESIAEVRLRKAQILRQLKDPEAQALYRSLLDSCVAAEAHQGLGQVAVVAGDFDQALAHMREAARLYPASFKIRNDLGFVHLQRRELEKARFEFMTALELSQDDALPLENLMTLLIYQQRPQAASALLSNGRGTPLQYQRAETRARQMQLEDQQRR